MEQETGSSLDSLRDEMIDAVFTSLKEKIWSDIRGGDNCKMFSGLFLLGGGLS